MPLRSDRIDVPFSVKSIEEVRQSDGSTVGAFEGLASVFGNKDMVGDIVAPGAFRDSIRSPNGIKMLWQHDSAQPIGTWRELRETDRGLEAKGHLLLGVQKGNEAHQLLKAGALDGLSIGFRIPKGGAEFDQDSGIRNDQQRRSVGGQSRHLPSESESTRQPRQDAQRRWPDADTARA